MPLGELDDDDLSALHEAVCFASRNEEEFLDFLESRSNDDLARRFEEESEAHGNALVGRVYRVISQGLRERD